MRSNPVSGEHGHQAMYNKKLFLTRRGIGYCEKIFVPFVPLCEIELGCGLRPH